VLRQSSSQLQKYKDAHAKSAVKHTQRYDGQFTILKYGWANVSTNSSRVEKVCGWDGGHPGLTV